MDGVFGSIQVIEVVIMLVFNEVLAHGLGQLQEVCCSGNIVTDLSKSFD